MKHLTNFFSLNFFILALFASSAFPSGSQDNDTLPKTKPYLLVTPSQPIAGKDSVTVQIILGTASNSCTAPTYSNLSFKIEQSPLTIYPPIYIVKVNFTEEPLPPNKICPAVYAPVDYGPVFKLGVLKVGTYEVIKEITSNNNPISYGKFSVLESSIPAYTIKGTVKDDPYPMKRMNMPIPKAVIYLYQRAITFIEGETSGIRAVIDSTISDDNGNYLFMGVSRGSYVMACKHPDYRSVSINAVISKDTVINFTLVPNDAYAAVTGTVMLIGSDISRPIPVEGCTVVVKKDGNTIDPSLPDVADDKELRAVTDPKGKYTIDKIPITANGEIWQVRAFIKEYSQTKKVALYNMRTDTVNFTFSTPYENSASVNIDGVIFTTAADKFVYQEKEPVLIRYSITNTTNVTKIFGPFSKGCEYDLIVSTPSAEREVYTASAGVICIDQLSEIVVNPGETVFHDFPAWYISNIKQIASAGDFAASRSVKLMFSARLRGAKYDNTLVGVWVTIELEPPVGTVYNAENFSNGIKDAITYSDRQKKLDLKLEKAQTVSISIYSLDGSSVPYNSISKSFPAGIHSLSLKDVLQTRGLYIIRVKGEGFEKRFNALHVGR